MLGFGNTELILFQTSKELLENASDSIRMLDPGQIGMEPRIELILDFSDPNLCALICNDTGIGIKSATMMFKCFNSSKEFMKPEEERLNIKEESSFDDIKNRNKRFTHPSQWQIWDWLKCMLTLFLLEKRQSPNRSPI